MIKVCACGGCVLWPLPRRYPMDTRQFLTCLTVHITALHVHRSAGIDEAEQDVRKGPRRARWRWSDRTRRARRARAGTTIDRSLSASWSRREDPARTRRRRSSLRSWCARPFATPYPKSRRRGSVPSGAQISSAGRSGARVGRSSPGVRASRSRVDRYGSPNAPSRAWETRRRVRARVARAVPLVSLSARDLSSSLSSRRDLTSRATPRA